MRRNPTPTITPQMYRHFATLTVALTALLAFFANGESQEAAATAAVPTMLVHEPRAAPPQPQLEIDTDDGGSWGSDASETVQQTVIGPHFSGSRASGSPFGLDQSRGASVGPRRDGVDESESADSSAAPTASQIAAIEAASRLRSGARGTD